MSNVPAEQPAEMAASDVVPHHGSEVKIYSHSTIFYWWPVWVVGFVMAAITYSEG